MMLSSEFRLNPKNVGKVGKWGKFEMTSFV